MNPASFNSSSSPLHFIDLNEDIDHQHLDQHSISNIPPQQQLPTSSLSCPIFFNLTDQHHYQSGSTHPRESLQNQDKVEKFGLLGGSSESKSTRRSSDDGSVKWMSSEMRVMRKMRAPNSSRTDKSVEHKFNDIHHSSEINSTHHYSSTEILRVCSDCNTTKTPLWRGGPQGPKSLCNACGIRQRKARKAMALAVAAANAAQTSDSSTSTNKTQKKEKKSRKSYVMQPKQHGTCPQNTGKRFEDFALSLISKNNSANFQRVFPQDEEEAALLLMALSCGFIHG